MNITKKIILLLIFCLFSFSSLHAYSYASAGKEPTLDGQDGILNAINENDFKKAQEVFSTYSKNYKYLNDDFNKDLYVSLEKAIKDKNKKDIVKWLRISIALEVERRLDGGLQNINTFNVSKVMLAKANKFYKILSGSLEFRTNKALKKAIKNCINSIGNPGLFGVGAKPINLKEYKKNQEIAVKILKSI